MCAQAPRRGTGRVRRPPGAPSAPHGPSGYERQPCLTPSFDVRRLLPSDTAIAARCSANRLSFRDDRRAAGQPLASAPELAAEDAAAGILRVGAERLLDPQQLVVLRDAVRARGRAGLDLPAA